MGTDGGGIVIGVVGVLVNLVFLGFLAMQVRLLGEQNDEASEATAAERLRVRRQATVEYTARTLQRRHELALKLPMESNRAAVNQFLEEVGSDREKLQNLYNYLNHWEEFSSAANIGIFDDEVIFRTTEGVIVLVEAAYRDFVARVRDEEDRPTLYVETAMLAGRMRNYHDEWRADHAVSREDAGSGVKVLS
jgi:PAS domain-containing protein